MFQHQGIWLPDGEAHFPKWMDANGELVDGRGTYQIRKYRAAMGFMAYPNLRRAIDVGAHVGFWSLQMIRNFDLVEAFEPVAAFRACFRKNLPSAQGKGNHADWVLHDCALGAEACYVSMRTPALDGGIDSGGTHVNPGLVGKTEMRTLDSFEFSMVDFVKIDCEGFEHKVIEGARETLLAWKPCVIVEQKPHKLGPNFGIKGTPACDLLRELGAVERLVISGDHIFTWRDRGAAAAK